jgi:NAD(P)-dependent dehydrogenase (short-subunit alcohol dehydrogenase family)
MRAFLESQQAVVQKFLARAALPAVFAEPAAPAPLEPVGRFLMAEKPAPLEVAPEARLSGLHLVTVDADSAIEETVGAVLSARGAAVAFIPAEALRDPEKLAFRVAGLREANGPVHAVLHLAGVAPLPFPVDVAGWHEVNDTQCKGFFHLLQICAADLNAQRGQVFSFSALGGSFGRSEVPWKGLPTAGAAVGLLKTLAIEWPDAAVKAIDIDDPAPAALADVIVAELLNRDGEIEIGYEKGRRKVYTSASVAADAPAEPVPRWAARPDWVVAATGGARGITAETLKGILLPGMTLVLIGRAAEPPDESPETRGITDVTSLRRILLQAAKDNGQKPTPALIEKEISALQRDREIRRNLAGFREMGVTVEYHGADTRDVEAFGKLLEDVYTRLGRIDAVLHGAGIIEDKLLVDKDPASFTRVFNTKADSTFALLKHLRPDGLKWVVLFTSVAGRTGNRGQCDYASANELLNRLAWWMHHHWTNTKISAVNWGPWESGMASAEVNRQFRERGIVPIPPLAGRQFLVDEMRAAQRGPVEMVAGTFHPPKPPPKLPLVRVPAKKTGEHTWEYTHTLSLAAEPYLGCHRIDGTPVMPAVGAMELMAETVQMLWPDWEVVEVQDSRLFRGMLMKDNADLPILISGETLSATVDEIRVEAGIRPAEGPGAPYYRGTFVLRREIPDPIDPPPGLPVFEATELTADDVYKTHAFHGPTFQLLRTIDGLDRRGVSATLFTPLIDHWVTDLPAGADWLFHPGLLDASTHAGLLWVRTLFDTYGLAAVFGRVRRFGPKPKPGEIFHLHLLNTKMTPAMTMTDFRLMDESGKCRFVVEEFESTLSKALNRLAPTPAT